MRILERNPFGYRYFIKNSTLGNYYHPNDNGDKNLLHLIYLV